MSRIEALDEITARLGRPALLRWVDSPYGGAAAIARFRHRGALVDLKASGTFRLIFQLSSSEVLHDSPEGVRSRDRVPAGSIIPSFTDRPERIHVVGAADTLHLLFSPELTAACEGRHAGFGPAVRRELQAIAAQTLAAASLEGTDLKLQQAVASVARLVVEEGKRKRARAGGLAPQARQALAALLERRLADGVSVREMADAAHLSLHHFIKVCRESEGLTPHALLIQRRFERSMGWLLEGSAGLDEIAIRLGFSSTSHFVSAFRRWAGVTPAAMRRAARR